MGTRTIKGPTNQLVEIPESPRYNQTRDGMTKTRTYRCDFAFGESSLSTFAVGTIGTGDESGFTLRESSLAGERGSIGLLNVVWEATGAGSGAILPPDEVSVTPDNQVPRVERHPIFKPLQGKLVGTEAVLDIVENLIRAQNQQTRETESAKLAGHALALKLVEKIQAGNESFYLASLRTSWATHSWTLPTISRGGFRQPVQGPLASYFVSNLDWLREGDDLQYQAGIWRWTRTWLGAPLGHWDFELYL